MTSVRCVAVLLGKHRCFSIQRLTKDIRMTTMTTKSAQRRHTRKTKPREFPCTFALNFSCTCGLSRKKRTKQLDTTRARCKKCSIFCRHLLLNFSQQSFTSASDQTRIQCLPSPTESGKAGDPNVPTTTTHTTTPTISSAFSAATEQHAAVVVSTPDNNRGSHSSSRH